MWIRRKQFLCSTALLACCLFTAQAVRADVIVLRNGERLHGTIANRALLTTQPETFTQVALLDASGGGEPQLHRFHVMSIDYIILEDQGGETVLDLAEIVWQGSAGSKRTPPDASGQRRAQGSVLIGLGLAMVLAGAIIPFGDENTPSYVNFGGSSRETYTSGNYALMIGGGVLTLGGIAMVASSPREKPRSNWNLSLQPSAQTVSLAYRMGY